MQMASGSNFVSDVKAEFDVDSVKFVSEICGSSQQQLNQLPDVAARLLADELTVRIRELVCQAKKFMIHARRNRLLASDIDTTLRYKCFDPIFGFGTKQTTAYRYGGSLGRDLYVVEDNETDIAQTLLSANVPKIPIDITVRAHWLVIDGEQPNVPENIPTLKNVDDIVSAGGSRYVIGSSGKELPMLVPGRMRSIRKTEQIYIKHAIAHPLSLEQQKYYKEVMEACVGSDEKRRTEALQSLLTDTGLQSLLSKFAMAISEGVRCNVVQHNLALLIYLMRITQSLINNATVNLEHELHLIIPSVLSCILGRQLCARLEVDNHWALREFSSRLLAALCRSYHIGDVRERITKILTDAYRSVNSSNATLYGALYALMELGYSEEIKNIILSRLSALLDDTRPVQVHKNTADKMASDRLHALLQKFEQNTNRGVYRRYSGVGLS